MAARIENGASEERKMEMEANKKKKERTANWQDCEIRVLLEGVSDNKDGLFAALSAQWTSKKKTDLWRRIAAEINARGQHRREWRQVKKKWCNMKARAVAHASACKRVPTGGGPKDVEEWWVDMVLTIVGKDNQIITGICSKGSGESAVLLDPDTDDEQFNNNEDADVVDEEETIIMQQVFEHSKVLADALGIDLEENDLTAENDLLMEESETGAFSSLPKASTPKRRRIRADSGSAVHAATLNGGACGSSSIDKISATVQGNVPTTTANFSQSAAPIAGSSRDLADSSKSGAAQIGGSSKSPSNSSKAIPQPIRGSSKSPAGSSKSVAAPTAGSSKAPARKSSTPPVDRLAQLKQRKKKIDDVFQDATLTMKDRKTVTMLDTETDKILSEDEYFKQQTTLVKLNQTNAKLLQLQLYYEIKKLERKELGQVPTGQRVEDLVQFDIGLPGRVGMLDGENDD